MEPYPYHYSHRNKPESIDPNFHMMLDELQRMEARLGEKIEGCCSNLEKYVEDVDQRAKERFISLEMACAEVDAERAATDKQVGDMKLEVSHHNHFLEQENLANS
jgi:hypothetical protein